MNVSVGLVSATCFRVPSAGVLDTFGRGSVGLPPQALADDDKHGPGVSGRNAARILSRTSSSVTPAQAEQAETILGQEDALTSLHRAWYPTIVRPEAPALVPPDEDAIRRRRSESAREGVRWFDVGSRRRAVRTAIELAETDIGAAVAAGEAWVETEEKRIDTWWNALSANDSVVVPEHLRQVFQMSGTPAIPMSVRGGLLDVAVLMPGDHVLPSNSVHLVGGSLSIRRASRAHRSTLQRQMIAGLLIAVARQAFASAPGLTAVRAHALQAVHRGRHDDLSVTGIVELARQDLATADLSQDAESLLLRYGSGLRWYTHSADGALRPILLEDVPELAEVLARLCRDEVSAPSASAMARQVTPA